MSESLWRTEYDFSTRQIEVDGHNMHLVDQGDGSPVVFVHGNPTWSFYYRRLIRMLPDGLRAIAPDHIGCGLSDKPQAYEYTLNSHVENLCALIDSLHLENVSFVAHDWGGAIAMGCAATMADRVRSISLFNTAAFPPPYFPLRIRACRFPILGAFAMRGLNLFSRAALSMAMSRTKLSKTARVGLLAPYNSWHNRVAVNAFVRDIPANDRHATWNRLAEIEASLPEFCETPVQLVWGMKDWCFNEQCLQRFMDAWPHASVLKLNDVGHYVCEDATDDDLSAVIEFLSQHAVQPDPTEAADD